MILMTFERGIAELNIHEAIVFEPNPAGFIGRVIKKSMQETIRFVLLEHPGTKAVR